MQDLIRPDPSISPREIFARMQGAWFEPRQGYMWQENTGATPTTSGGQTIGKIVDLSAGRVASQATAANRPTLQYNGNLPLIRSDSTDFLTATLPAINVRRNLMTYTEQFDNAAWAKVGPTVTPDVVEGPFSGTTADKLVFSAQYQSLRTSFNVTAGTTYTYSIYCRVSSGTRLYHVYDGLGASIGSFTASVNWSRYVITFTAQNTTNLFVIQDRSTTGFVDTFIFGAQLELGSVATDYQKITDWTSETYSSSGSTYFSTPSGMSCLHNQSIGTSYNLPALQTDIYGTVITPARLAPPLEQRLALYMHRLAGLSDADFFWQEQATDGMTGQLLADDNDTILLRA